MLPAGGNRALPPEVWAEIKKFLDQPEFIREQVNLARVSHAAYAAFGGYLFVFDDNAMAAALAYAGEAQAIVIPYGTQVLTVGSAPRGTAAVGGPLPIVSYGDTVINSGWVHIYGTANVNASGEAEVHAHDQSRVTASGEAEVHAHDQSRVTASGEARVVTYNDGVDVTASGDVEVQAWEGSRVTASGDARVRAFDTVRVIISDTAQVLAEGSVNVTGIGPDVVIYWCGDPADIHTHITADPATIRQVESGEGRAFPSFEDLKAHYPAPKPTTDDQP